MDKEKLEKNFEQIVKETNKYLEKYEYKAFGDRLLSVSISKNNDNKYELLVNPKGAVWSNFIVDWDKQGDIILKDKDEMSDIKLTFQGDLLNYFVELIIHKICQSLISERDYLQSEIEFREEQEELEYECWRSED